MTKRRTPPNGNAHAAAVPGKIEPRADADPALMDVVLPAGLDGESVDAMTAAGADTHVPADLAAGDAEVGNTLQTYLREIRRAPLLTPQEEYDTATRARLGDFKARQAMIVFTNFTPPAGTDYELWALRGGPPQSLGLIRPDASGRAIVKLPDTGDPAGLAAFAVSLEKAGGSRSPAGPEGPVVMVGKLGGS